MGDLVDLGPKNECPEDTEVGFVPLQRLGVDYCSRHSFEPKPWSTVKKGYTHFADGDVLLARITPSFENGKAGIARGLPNGLGAGSTEYFVCRPLTDALLPEYLLAHFKTPRFLRDGEQVMSGAVGQQRVPKQYVLDSRLPLAPLNEQKRIADKLDAVLARVDACRERLDRVPAILKRFRQSVLAAATSGKLTEEWREKRNIGDTWADTTIGNVAFVTKLAGFEYTKYVKYCDGGDLKVLKAENAGKWGFRYTDFSTVRSDEVSMLSRSRIFGGDSLMVFVGAGTGQVARVPEGDNWFLGPNIALIRANKTVLSSEYLEYYCRSPLGWREVSGYIKSVAQPSLSMKTIRQVRIALPSIAEQTEIVRRVESLFAYADRLEARYTAARAQVERLTQALLAKAFRGELVPQDPNDEPAAVLLARIRAVRESAPAKSEQRKGGGRPKKTQKAEVTTLNRKDIQDAPSR